MNSPSGTPPNKLIPATPKVNRMSSKRAAVLMIFPRDMKRVLRRVLIPSDVLIILKSLETLMILRAVGLKLIYSRRVSSEAIKDIITIMKSNLFQFTYQ